MKNINGMTPKEAAIYETLISIEDDYYGGTSARWNVSELPNKERCVKFERKFRRHLAKLHNKLLNELTESYDGDIGFYELDEDPPKSEFV